MATIIPKLGKSGALEERVARLEQALNYPETLLPFSAVGEDFDATLDLPGTMPPGVLTHNLLSATHPDTLADSVVRGDLVVGNATPKWARLPISASVAGSLFTSSGPAGDPSWTTDLVWTSQRLQAGVQAPANNPGGDFRLFKDTATEAALIGNANHPVFTTYRTGGTLAAPSSFASSGGFNIGALRFGGHDGTSYGLGVDIRGLTLQAWTSGAHGARLTVGVAPIGATALVEALSIESTHVALPDAKELRLFEPSGSGSNYTAHKAQAQVANLTYTWPPAIVAGGVLTTDGSGGLTWAAAPPPGVHNFLDSTVHNNTVTALPQRGDLIVGNATPAWARFARGTANEVLVMNGAGTDPDWALLGNSNVDPAALLDAVARTIVRKNSGANVGTRRRLNFIEGSNISLTVTDDAGSEEVDITIASAVGAHNLLSATHTDTNAAAAPAGGDLIWYNNSTNLWDVLVNPGVGGRVLLINTSSVPDWTTIGGEATLADTGALTISAQTSATWRGKVTDETGTGLWVFNDTPTFATKIYTPRADGGTATSSSLALRANDQTFDLNNTGRINMTGVTVWDVTSTPTADVAFSPGGILDIKGTITAADPVNTNILAAIQDQRTLAYSVAQSSSFMPTFHAVTKLQPTASVADSGTMYAGFYSAPRYHLETAAVTASTPTLAAYVAQPYVHLISGTALTITNVTGFGSGNGPGAIYYPLSIFTPPIKRSAGTLTITNWRHFHASDPDTTGTYTMTTQVGMDIEALTKGSTNIGLRNASSTVFTPSTSQVIDAATDTILANATFVMVSNTTAGSITLTSTPTIADGQNGQLVTIVNVGTQNIVLRDQSAIASNLRTPGAADLTLGVRDAVTFIYSSTVGDWVCVGTSNN